MTALLNLHGAAPFSVVVDNTIAEPGTLPPFANGLSRTLATLSLRTSDGYSLRYVENEMLVMTDSVAELNAIKSRLNAPEVASPAVSIPGLLRGVILRIDAARANPSTLVSNLQNLVNRPDGEQKVSSGAALRTLATPERFRKLTRTGR